LTKIPNVIFNGMYTPALNNPSSHNKTKTIKRATDMYDYFSNEEKKAVSMFDYYTGNLTKDEEMNLIVENGKYASKKEIESRKKKIVKYLENSNLWQGVISFNNDYINKNIDVHKLEKEMATKVLPMFFKKCGFKDSKKMFYQLSLHTDTDNLHFHLSWMEKEPNYVNSKGNLCYRKKGTLLDNEINFLKNEVAHTIEKEKIYTDKIITINNELDELKTFFNPNEKNYLLKNKEDLFLEARIYELGKRLDEIEKNNGGKIYYNTIKDKEVKKIVRYIKYHLLNHKEDFKCEYLKFKESLKDLNDYFSIYNGKNNIDSETFDFSYTKSKEKRVMDMIGNFSVNAAKTKRITEEDYLKMIIHNSYKKGKLLDRKQILNNYLSTNKNKVKKHNLVNSSEIKNAVKKLNYEMDKSADEFSNLFDYDDQKDMKYD